MPQWPPSNYDYSSKLLKQKLVEVPIEKWMDTPDFIGDDVKLKKVYLFKHYPGVFEDSKGQMYDLRPYETCPNIRNFSKIHPIKLMEMLKEAYQMQITELETLEPDQIGHPKVHSDKLILYKYLLFQLMN